MSKKQKQASDQSQRFIGSAREFGYDRDADALDRALRKVGEAGRPAGERKKVKKKKKMRRARNAG